MIILHDNTSHDNTSHDNISHDNTSHENITQQVNSHVNCFHLTQHPHVKVFHVSTLTMTYWERKNIHMTLFQKTTFHMILLNMPILHRTSLNMIAIQIGIFHKTTSYIKTPKITPRHSRGPEKTSSSLNSRQLIYRKTILSKTNIKFDLPEDTLDKT